MKGAICYYSGSGNTQLICRLISETIKNTDFELINVTKCQRPDLSGYDVVGLASSTFYMGVPKAFDDFIHGINPQAGKPAFLINTYGMMQGRALKLMKKAATARGFAVIAAHSVHMPENYPVFIAKGWSSADKPDEQQVSYFRDFISELSSKMEQIQRGEELPAAKIAVGFLNSVIPVKSREKIAREIGGFQVDASLCSRCGVCVEKCPYQAAVMDAYPVFNPDKCWGCFSCYNHCPQGAIYTDNLSGDFQYSGPDKKLREKLRSGLEGDIC